VAAPPRLERLHKDSLCSVRVSGRHGLRGRAERDSGRWRGPWRGWRRPLVRASDCSWWPSFHPSTSSVSSIHRRASRGGRRSLSSRPPSRSPWRRPSSDSASRRMRGDLEFEYWVRRPIAQDAGGRMLRSSPAFAGNTRLRDHGRVGFPAPAQARGGLEAHHGRRRP